MLAGSRGRERQIFTLFRPRVSLDTPALGGVRCVAPEQTEDVFEPAACTHRGTEAQEPVLLSVR